MSLPDIDFKQIRIHGNQADAFEELCCQLASDEASSNRIKFDRKGRGGDAGIECFETLADGSEIGWQVKFYWDIDSMLRSLDKSLDTALAKHSNMRKFIACFPFDLADARKKNTNSALEKWETWRADRIKRAHDVSRKIEIERWDAHALRQRLTGNNPRAAGRVAFWFDQQLLTQDWLEAKFERTKASLGDRYDQEGNIDLRIGRAIHAVTGEPALFEELASFAEAVQTVAGQAFLINGTQLASDCDAAARALYAAALRQTVSVSEMRKAVEAAADAALQRLDSLEEANGGETPTNEMRTISNLAGQLREIVVALHEPHWELLDARSLLVHGDAGCGKSHLLADACARHLEAGRPALMVLGGALADAEPWGQIIQGLDLPRHLEVRQFLGALNAAGEAAGVCTLIAIDAINEKNGQVIWPDQLAGFLYDIEQFPWVAVVLSCRSTYLDIVVPETLPETKLPRIEHRGFSIKQVRAYLQQRGMILPETPLQAAEFQIPLFLRLYCDAIEFEGDALLARGLGGVTDIFKAYTGAVIRRVHQQMKTPPGRDYANKALDALAREMGETGRAEISLDRAGKIVRDVHPGRSIEDDLLFQLENEGLLAVEPMVDQSAKPVQMLRFTFERMGDHAIAADLIDRSNLSSYQNLCTTGTPLHFAIVADDSMITFGLLEALAIQLPERFDIELPDLTGVPDALNLEHAFVQSLHTRHLDAISQRTWQLIDAIGGAPLRYDTLVALATEPAHFYNARFLDAELHALPMSMRDARWSVHLAQSPEAAFHLIDWIRSADPSAIASERTELAATQLSWFLTASHRSLRDKATKALVSLFSDRATLALKLWNAFFRIDDLYVVERLTAAIYGAAMQGRWSNEELKAVAETLHGALFADGTPPANLLLRDHARGMVGYAAARGAMSSEFDLASIQPPFSSPWPIEQISQEQMATFTCVYVEDGERFDDKIASSLNDGDFARYVLDPVVRRFSPAPYGTDPLPTTGDLKAQWLAEFTVDATESDMKAYSGLEAEMATIRKDKQDYAVDRNALIPMT